MFNCTKYLHIRMHIFVSLCVTHLLIISSLSNLIFLLQSLLIILLFLLKNKNQKQKSTSLSSKSILSLDKTKKNCCWSKLHDVSKCLIKKNITEKRLKLITKSLLRRMQNATPWPISTATTITMATSPSTSPTKKCPVASMIRPRRHPPR